MPIAPKFKLHLRHLFVAIPFESQTKDDPLLIAVAFLKEAFARDKPASMHPREAEETFVRDQGNPLVWQNEETENPQRR
jgi:hypothetical protein